MMYMKLLLECATHCHTDEWTNWLTTMHNDGNNYVYIYGTFKLRLFGHVATIHYHSVIIINYSEMH